MKPSVNRIVSAPLTALICCPQCYGLISYPADQKVVKCHSCATVVKGADPHAAAVPRPD